MTSYKRDEAALRALDAVNEYALCLNSVKASGSRGLADAFLLSLKAIDDPAFSKPVRERLAVVYSTLANNYADSDDQRRGVEPLDRERRARRRRETLVVALYIGAGVAALWTRGVGAFVSLFATAAVDYKLLGDRSVAVALYDWIRRRS